MLDAAIFDMDGLLVDSEPLWQEAEIEVFADVGLALTRAQFTETKGRRVDEAIAYWFARHPWPGVELAEVERRLVRRVEELIRARAEAKPGVGHALEDSIHGVLAAKAAGVACIAVPDASSPSPDSGAGLAAAGLVLGSRGELDERALAAIEGRLAAR